MIDLHVHTINSDGDFTTEEILKDAEKNGINILSITDHNNINAYDDIKKLSIDKLFTGRIITGTELEFAKDGRIFEVLGYGFDPELIKDSDIIREGMVHSTIEGETKILNQLKKICDDLGIKYNKDLHIERANYMANDVLVDDILNYSENEDILNKMGIKDRGSFYRCHFCEPTSPFYLNQADGKYDIYYVSNLIRSAGGKVFFAHPFEYRFPNIKEILDYLVSEKLIDGVECEHRKHKPEEIDWIKKYCDEHNLFKSGGSDKHTEGHLIGHSNYNQRVIDDSLVDDWINLIQDY